MRSIQAINLLCALLAGGAGAIGAPALGQEAPGVLGAPVVAPAVPPVDPAVLSDDAIAMRDGLAAALAPLPAGERDAVLAFYATRAYAPFWTAPGTTLPADLAAALASAGDQALPAGAL